MLKDTSFFKNSNIDLDMQSLQYKLNYYTGVIATQDTE